MKSIIRKPVLFVVVAVAACTGAYLATQANPPSRPAPSEKPNTSNSEKYNGEKNDDGDEQSSQAPAPSNAPSPTTWRSNSKTTTSSVSSPLDESKMPNGRYRSQVFSLIKSSKDIRYATRNATMLIEESPTNFILADDTNTQVDLKLNLYQPENDPVLKRPLIIFVYGGGWVFGDRYQQEASAEYYARMGYVTMTIDYSMLPADAPAPVPTEDFSVYTRMIKKSSTDLYDAYQYALAHSQEYGVDTTRIGFAGWSAGGLISSSLANMAALPTPYGLKAVLGASSNFSSFLADLDVLVGGLKTFSTNYSPTHMFASYDDDTGYGGTPNDHVADCAYLNSIGHTCTSVTYPGSGHQQEFYQTPLVEYAVPFLAQYVAGY